MPQVLETSDAVLHHLHPIDEVRGFTSEIFLNEVDQQHLRPVRNLLTGPSTVGLNLGVKKIFKIGERARAELGADVQNLLNHPLLSPDSYDIANLGDFSLQVNPRTLKPEIASVTPNPDFGRLLSSFSQEGVDSRRTIRLRLRITF